MPRDGKPTRDKILTASKELIYENGFAGTSIDLILEKAGITKGAFFYHFKTKADLALVMVREFAEADLVELDKSLTDTEELRDAPKNRLLAFIQRFIDMFNGLSEPPSCLYASVSNEQNQYSDEIKQIVSDTILAWRKRFEEMIDEVASHHKARFEIDKPALADHFNVVMEGAFIISKSLNDPTITARQLTQLKNYFDLLFE